MKNAGIRTSTLACTNSIMGQGGMRPGGTSPGVEGCVRSDSSVTKRRAGELATERYPRVAGGDGRPSGDATNRGAAPAGNRRVARETSAVDDFARSDHAGGNTAAAVLSGRRRGDVHEFGGGTQPADVVGEFGGGGAITQDERRVDVGQTSRGGWIGASPTGSASTAATPHSLLAAQPSGFRLALACVALVGHHQRRSWREVARRMHSRPGAGC